jgi:SNF2-related domain/Helicase conserved C-terminal domain
MKDLTAAVRAEPELVGWLGSGLWRRSFDRGSLGRAEGYANAGDIQVLEVDRLNGDSIACEAKVRGSGANKYHTRVGFFSTARSWAVHAECSCPVGLFCKHGAAIILRLLDQLAPRPVAKAQAPAPVRQDPRVSLWLESLRGASRSLAESPKWVSEERRFLAFCLQPLYTYHEPDAWHFTLRVGTRAKDGEAFSISDSVALADPSKPPKYMVREDFVPASLYHQRKRKEACWDEMALKGGSWEDLLETAIATGRCYVSGDGEHRWIPARLGPNLQVNAGWTILQDGDALPKIDFEDGRPRVILATVPPRYLDRTSGEVGLMTANLPAPLLGSWITGPPVPARLIESISDQLQQLAPALPTPVAMETVDLPEAAPVPHLLIRKKVFGKGYQAEEFIFALVQFRYHGGKLLRPLSKNESSVHYEIHGNKRHVLQRDVRAELAAEGRLVDLGFTPLRSIVPDYLMDPETLHAWLPEDMISDPFQEFEVWSDYVHGDSLLHLRAEGWVIEVDPATGLVIHDAVGFFPSIEADPDHGIEWFRFDAGFEIDGRRLSLIPIIARAIQRGLPSADAPDLPEYFVFPGENPEDGSIRFPARRLMEIVDQVRHLFQGRTHDGPLRIDRLGAATVADALALDSSETVRSLARLARNLKEIHALPEVPVPETLNASLRGYQTDGFRWLQFLTTHSLNGILADDMGLGKTVQTLAHLAAESAKAPGRPSLVIAPTSVVPNWAAEAEKFTPHLRVLTLHGKERGGDFHRISESDIVITSYPLLVRDFEILANQQWHTVVLDEAQYIKNPKAIAAQNACKLKASHRVCLSGTPMENHLGELWSLMRFLMPGLLGDEKSFNSHLRRPIERDRSHEAQLTLNRRVSPLILRRTKDQVATELPAKTELIHTIDLTKKQTDLYESVRATMDKRVRDAIAAQGLAKSHIIVLDALLKLRQICCHPQLLKSPAAQKVADSAKLDYLTEELLPTLLEEGRRILLFSTFTSMLELIEAHLEKQNIPHLKLTGQTRDRASLVKRFQAGEVPIFLISLKAGGTGLNLTAADTVIHYDPWWNPAAENQATDRAHRIGQTKPVFVHKLVCRGTIEDRILELQKHKAALVEALLSEETSKLRIDSETLSHLLAPLE